MKLLLLILSAFAVVHSGPLLQANENTLIYNGEDASGVEFRSLVEKFGHCAKSDVILCLKENALKATEIFSRAREFKIFEGMTLLNNNPKKGRSIEMLTTLPTEPRARDRQLTERLLKSASDLIQSSDLSLSYPNGDEEDADADAEEDTDADAEVDAESDEDADAGTESDEADESRGKKKKKKKKKKEEIRKKLKILIPLILFAKIKGILLVVFSIVLIAKSVFKLALLAKIAFIIKMFSALKSHLSKKPEKEGGTYEVNHTWEPEHIHFEHGPEWDGGWSRSRNKSNNMPYSAQINNNNKELGIF